MKKVMKIAVATALLGASLCSFAAMDDVVFSCVSHGADCYADGTPVADGECYAFVFTKPGFKFAGFNLDGSLVNPEQDSLAAVAPVAKDGGFPGAAFQMSARYASLHAGDTRGVYLLDTRRADGMPVGAPNGVLTRVNRYSSVPVTQIVSPSFPSIATDVVVRGTLGADGVYTMTTDEVANLSGIEKPVITGVKVEDGIMYVTVAKASANVTWAAVTGEAANQIGQPEGAMVDGDDNGEIVFEIPVDSDVKFVKVVNRQAIEGVAMEVK